VLCGTTLFLFSMFLAPRRGIVAVAAGVLSLRSKTARENLLRRLYELSEPALPERPGIERARVLEILGWSAARGRWQLARAARRGMVELAGGAVCLTAEGLARAVDVTRAHRLWELFLIEGVRIAPDHVDRDADAVEHLLPAEVVARLEKRLAPARGAARIPESPHALDERP
jgi:Mn-dependent DtxR family transcriptional regulator